MSTQVNISNWSKTLSLDRHVAVPVFHDFVDLASNNDRISTFAPILRSRNLSHNQYQGLDAVESPLLYTLSLRRNLEESRKAFLNFYEPKEAEEKVNLDNKENLEQKKTPSRKISFKCKKPSQYRRIPASNNKVITTLNPNTVAELTSKFNEMVSDRISILEQPKFAQLVRRVNSLKSTQAQEEGSNKKVARKPSVKIKPLIKTEEKHSNEQKKRPSLKHRNSARTKTSHTETSSKTDIPPPSTTSKPSPNTGNVRATIEIFEKRISQTSSPDIENTNFVKEFEKVPKPKVPEKNPNIKLKDLVIKNGVKKLKVFEKCDLNNKTDIVEEEEVQILNIPLIMPRRCDSKYETMHMKKISPPKPKTSPTSNIVLPDSVKPNTSFLWRQKSQDIQTNDDRINNQQSDWETLYDAVETKLPPAIPPRPTSLNLFPKPKSYPKTIFKTKMPLPDEVEEKIYEELEGAQIDNDSVSHSYEYCRSPSKYEDLEQKSDDGYEYFEAVSSPTKPEMSEDIYETLPAHVLLRIQEEPLPPRPSSRDSYCTIQNGENASNCYESIYNSEDRKADENDVETISNNYESIYGGQIRIEQWESASNRDSMVSSDQQSNSLYSRSLSGWPNDETNLYNGKASSDLSGSDKSDEWIDISDNEDNSKGVFAFVIVRERQKSKKTSGWSQKIRDQWNKSHSSADPGDIDSDHHYESLYNAQDYHDHDDYDSFDSDTESEISLSNNHQKRNGIDMGNSQLPDPPANQSYGLTRLAVSAGKHMKRLRRNWSLTKNDITKSLSRMAKRKSRTDLDSIDTAKIRGEMTNPTTSTVIRPISSPIVLDSTNPLTSITQELKSRQTDSQTNTIPYQNSQTTNHEALDNSEKNRTNNLSKKKFLNKFRRSMSISSEMTVSEITQTMGNKPKSTFYLTDTIDVDDHKDSSKPKAEDIATVSPITLRNHKLSNQRPQSPPPPIPVDANQNIDSRTLKNTKRSTSWYAECGLFRNSEPILGQNLNKRPNTSWYAEIGLYQTSTSTPSTSSAENSGSAVNVSVKSTDEDTEEYYNLKNENEYYNHSVSSFSSDTTMDKSSSISADIQLRLQDEPLYQFYDAAVLESVCQDGTTDFDYDGYEEVGDKSNSDYSVSRSTLRPSAMQLISPSKNGVTVIRTLWCEIPEVLQSAVLSTLSIHQKKLQEAKFEMMTSEASYLNSLNVLTDHFITNLNNDFLTYEEKNVLFGKIPAVKRCSEKLLSDLEKCWQDNILLHGICDIIKRHAEENFHVYVSYCENQILLDSTLKKMKERNNCNELLKQMECSSACQSLSLYSFLMLPMQRITRWPLLVDAVLKRLSPQDEEYLPCQYTLATINKIVMQCNEAARKMERETEIKRIAAQIEFPRGVPIIKLASGSRWLVRSGPLTQMLARADDIKLTFGKRFTKVPLNLFLFNDLLLITKHRSDDCYVVLHYCYRSYIELNVNDVIGSFPVKDAQGRHLLFLTMLENHEGKTIEMLLSCSSESDKERWIEALSAPKSQDPDETLYECWDCPQVTAIHPYIANQPDELPLARGDIANVTRKMADGWYHGERIRDGQAGWFPANYTVEVANPHVRARNLKQRYRLLAFSENYLKSK